MEDFTTLIEKLKYEKIRLGVLVEDREKRYLNNRKDSDAISYLEHKLLHLLVDFKLTSTIQDKTISELKERIIKLEGKT